MKRFLSISVILFSSTLLFSCGSSTMPGGGDGTGGVTGHAVWPGGGGAKTGTVLRKAPSEVSWVRMIVSKDTTTLSADFAASAGSGSISGVPAGTGWTLTFQGLNTAKTFVYYAGSKSGITVTAGVTTNAGSVAMQVQPAMSGQLDVAFDADGIAITSMGTSTISQATDLAIQQDGKIVVVGDLRDPGGGTTQSLVIRYNPDGSLDTGFGTNGIVTFLTGSSTFTRSVSLQPDGKIVFAGYIQTGAAVDTFISRLLPDGRLDNAANDPTDNFTASGIATIDMGGADGVYDVGILDDGTIVAAGKAWLGAKWGFALVKYTATGGLLSAVTATAGSTTNDFGYTLSVAGDGSIFVAGDAWTGSESDLALIKFASNSTVENRSIVDVGFGKRELGRSIAILSSGKVLVAGPAGCDGMTSDSCFAIVRYGADGNIDTSFGTSGKVLTSFNGAASAEAYAIRVLPNDKFVVFGTVYYGTRWVFGLARYDASGNLDTTFNPSGAQPGTAITSIGSDMNHDCLYCGSILDQSFGLGIQPDGKVVTAAYAVTPSVNNSIALARYWNDVTTSGKVYGVSGSQFAVMSTYSSSLSTTLYRLYSVLTPSSSAISLVNAAVDAHANRLYTSDGGNGTGNKVYVIDTINNMTLAPVTVGTGPGYVLSSPGTNRLYVSNNGIGSGTTISVIDTSDNTVNATITGLSGPRGMDLDPSSNRLYVVNATINTVSVIDTLTNAAIPGAAFAGFDDPTSVVFDSATNKIFVANQGQGAGNTVSAINVTTNARSEITVGTGPFRFALDSGAQRLYVTNSQSGAGNSVSVIDTSTSQVIDTITVGLGARNIGIDVAAKKLYIDCLGDATVYVIDVTNDANTLLGTMAGGGIQMVVVP